MNLRLLAVFLLIIPNILLAWLSFVTMKFLQILAFYFVVSCICTNFAIGNHLKWG